MILDAAILYEAEWNDLCDQVVFVDATPEVRLARLETTRGWTAETLAAREKAQGPLAEKRFEADHVLSNNDSPDDLQAAAQALWPTCSSRCPDPDGSPTPTWRPPTRRTDRSRNRAPRTEDRPPRQPSS